MNVQYVSSRKKSPKDELQQQNLTSMGVSDVELCSSSDEQQEAYHNLLTPTAIKFVAQLVREFELSVDQLLLDRKVKKAELSKSDDLPDFLPDTQHIREGNWQVPPVPPRLINRNVDLGDVSPTNTQHFKNALNSNAQGIQVDFDDGHCPSWPNQLQGLYNVYKVVHDSMMGVPSIESAPVLMLRPRAWNMVEQNMLVNGRQVPGPLFDFGLLMFHNAKILLQQQSGPYFYLSKLEGYKEARLWNQIFVWTEKQLELPVGSIKAVVLIENVLASFEMHEILYELQQHSAGLNCGVWDYSASFVNKFGHRPNFVLPDRSTVNMERHFLKSYMDLTIKTCHSRGCHATGGMIATVLPEEDSTQTDAIVEKACSSKLKEIKAGVDGFLVYDIKLIEPMQQLWKKHAPSVNQYKVQRSDVNVTAKDLLLMPSGGVTLDGLKHNIAVGIMFIDAWLRGKGHFILKGAVEDSATAEISRLQVWQWIRHKAKLEDNGNVVTFHMVQTLVQEFQHRQCHDQPSSDFANQEDKRRLRMAIRIFETLVTARDFPEFITTYLSSESAFLASVEHFEMLT